MTCCLNKDCEKKNECKRYENTEYAIVNHKANCEEENYQWFWKKDEIKIDENKKENDENV